MNNRLSTTEIIELMGDCKDGVIFDGLIKSNQIINNPKYRNIMCSVSGGSDSDIIVDICTKLDVNHKVQYVWFDTGVEYQATKDHLVYLENRYGIEIIRERAIKTIPISVKEYGEPFVSKMVSEQIYSLQCHGFQWEDEPFEVLVKRYCKKADSEKRKKLDEQWSKGIKPYHWYLLDGEWYSGCVTPLEWWCNRKSEKDGSISRFCIGNNRWLKEFMIQNPPTFNISPLCCKYAKKMVSKKYEKEHNIDLVIMGIRKSEGGVRATAYKTCYSCNEDKVDQHRPIFYYTEENKRNYEETFSIVHSKCYTEYSLVRTGCVGCPFIINLQKALETIEEHEPKLYKAVENIFANTYQYTRQYREFQQRMKKAQVSKYEYGRIQSI